MQDDIQAVVGKRIAKLRKEKGFSQDSFAEAAGFNRAHIYKIETGQQNMTVKTLKAIADVLDVRITRLFRGF